jgi:hypothetical protein
VNAHVAELVYAGILVGALVLLAVGIASAG